jgi:two-component system, cell cycle response regulator DivK
VLVVDDVEDNREIYTICFEWAGFRVAQAADGEEALGKIAADVPSLVIMDLAMPRLDGWEATRRIKSSPQTRETIVIVVTGNTTTDGLRRAKAFGADEICVKPCNPRDLLDTARRLLARKRTG